MVIEFKEEDAVAFDEVMAVLKHYSGFEMFSMEEESGWRIQVYPGKLTKCQKTNIIKSSSQTGGRCFADDRRTDQIR